MAFVYQLEREALLSAIRRHAPHLTGHCLDIGSQGPVSRYKNILKNIGSYTSLEVDAKYQADITASAEDMNSVSSGSFDSIFCTQVLVCVHEPEKAIAEFSRVLSKGGTVLITTPFMNLYLGEVDYWRFTPNSLTLLLEKHGFEVVVMEKVAVGVFTVVNQMFNRFIKIGLDLKHKRLSRKVWNKIFIVTGKLCRWLDRRFASPTNEQFFLDLLVVARKR